MMMQYKQQLENGKKNSALEAAEALQE